HASNDGSTRARRLRFGGAAANEPTILCIIFFSAPYPARRYFALDPKSSHAEVTASVRIHPAPSRGDLFGLTWWPREDALLLQPSSPRWRMSRGRRTSSERRRRGCGRHDSLPQWGPSRDGSGAGW